MSLLDSLLFQSTGYLTLGALGVSLPRLGNQFRIAAPANTYRCRDGRIMAGVLLDSHWKRLASLLGRPRLAEDPAYATTAARLERRSEVDRWLAEWAREQSMAEAVDALTAAGLPAAPVRTYAEAASRSRTWRRATCSSPRTRLTARPRPVGRAPPPSSRALRPGCAAGAPELGASTTDQILSEISAYDERRRSRRLRTMPESNRHRPKALTGRLAGRRFAARRASDHEPRFEADLDGRSERRPVVTILGNDPRRNLLTGLSTSHAKRREGQCRSSREPRRTKT